MPASPDHRRDQLQLPDIWQHDDTCSCTACHDVDVIELTLQYVMCYAELYCMQVCVPDCASV